MTAAGASPRRIVSAIWLTYALFYLGRVNLSVALPALALALDASRAEVGALGTVFYWVYGIGHFISGEMGSHASPRRLVSLGLLAIALLNIAFGFQSALLPMLLLWSLNGLAQSAGWAPMLRILAERLERAQLKHIATIMPFSYVFGTALTWTVIGTVASVDWRVAFWLPGALLLLVLVLWRRAAVDAPAAAAGGVDIARILREARGIAFALLTAALAGFVFNGMIIWLPTYILDTGLVAENFVGAVAALLQVMAFAGLLLARYGVLRSNRVLPTAALLLAAAGCALLALPLALGALALLIIAIALVLLNGAFGLVVSALPLLLAPPGRASSITGSVNMMSNFFGGIAGFTVGGLVEARGWDAAFLIWGGALLLAAAVLWRRRSRENSAANG